MNLHHPFRKDLGSNPITSAKIPITAAKIQITAATNKITEAKNPITASKKQLQQLKIQLQQQLYSTGASFQRAAAIQGPAGPRALGPGPRAQIQ